MRFSKILLVCFGVALLAGFSASQFTSVAGVSNSSVTAILADGGAPPPVPPSFADGGAPPPVPPNDRRWRGSAPGLAGYSGWWRSSAGPTAHGRWRRAPTGAASGLGAVRPRSITGPKRDGGKDDSAFFPLPC